MPEGYDTYDWPDHFFPGDVPVCDVIPPDGRGVPEQVRGLFDVGARQYLVDRSNILTHVALLLPSYIVLELRRSCNQSRERLLVVDPCRRPADFLADPLAQLFTLCGHRVAYQESRYGTYNHNCRYHDYRRYHHDHNYRRYHYGTSSR